MLLCGTNQLLYFLIYSTQKNLHRFQDVEQEKSERFLRQNRIQIDQWRASSAQFTCPIYSNRSDCASFELVRPRIMLIFWYYMIYLLTVNNHITLLQHICYLITK